MSVAGSIKVTLRPDGRAGVESSRPIQLARAFKGLTAGEVLRRVPMLFALCGQAQRQAAALALNGAGCNLSPPDPRHALREAALEYLWRFAIDLPRWAAEPAAMLPFATFRKGMLQADFDDGAALLQRYLSESLLGEEVTSWAAMDVAQLLHWRRRSSSPAARMLRHGQHYPGGPLGAEALLPGDPDAGLLGQLGLAMGDDAFCAAPTLKGGCRETGALAYQSRHPWIERLLLDGEPAAALRLLARLLELAQLCQRLGSETAGDDYVGRLTLACGAGLGWVKTARGLLLHRARCDSGQVSDYRLLAPTEWNFHPRGVLADTLRDWERQPREQRQSWVALQVISLDPCVGYQLEVYDA